MKLNKMFMLAVALALYAIPLMGQDNAINSRQCSLATLNGSYSFFGEAPATLVVGSEQVGLVVSGIIRFDGHGNLSGESIDNLGGLGSAGAGRFDGTYTVNPDCTYLGVHTDELGQTLHFAGTIAGSGMLQEMRFVLADEGWVALGTDKKIPPGGCSLSTLRGSYSLFGQGTAFPDGISPVPIAHVGTVTYDGAGNFFGSDTVMLNGTMIPDTFTGKYTLTGECMISTEITSTAVGVIHEVGWIVGEGKSQEARLIPTDPGFMFVEATRKQ